VSIARLVLLAACCALLATAAPASAAVDWGACPPAPGGGQQDPRQQCATLAVPLDHAAPGGRTIDIAVSRIATSEPGRRRGVLLANPGGPGSRGLDMPTMLAQTLPADVLATYDLVGFDPRGIGRSAPVSCALQPDQLDILKFIPWPTPAGNIDANVAYARQVASQCWATSGDLLPHMTTANTARDMDRIRRALGEPRIAYLGYSYGTYLGAVYASLFPAATDRVVLDSNIHPGKVWRETWRSWGPGTERAGWAFFAWTAARDAEFGLGDTATEVRTRTLALLDRLDVEPVGPFTGTVLRHEMRRLLYDDDNFAGLAGALAALEAQSPAAARAAFPEPPVDNDFAGPWAVTCSEGAWPRDVETYRRDVQHDRERYPLAGGMAANIWPCAFWPEPREATVPIRGAGTARVLVVQGLFDPATPLEGGVAMRAAFGDRARLLTLATPGHGLVFTGENACADARAGAFLVRGEQRDGHCPDGAEPAPSAAADRLKARIRGRG
jgi:pimeloyl-ACP methyl ester carboxylesterase